MTMFHLVSRKSILLRQRNREQFRLTPDILYEKKNARKLSGRVAAVILEYDT